MTSNLKEKLNSDGYIVAKNIIDKKLLDEVRSDLHSIVGLQLNYLGIKKASQTTKETLFTDLKSLYQADLKRYLSALKTASALASFMKLYVSDGLTNTTRSLGIETPIFLTQPVLHVMAEELRIKDGYFGIGAHQDWPALQSSLDTLTTWIPLFPVRRNQFTLEIIPKSHLLGLVEATQEQHIHEVKPSVYENLKFEPVEIDDGDALVFSTFLIHKSEITGEPGAFRIAYSMRYENAADSNFVSRSYHSAQKRVVERYLAEKDTPSKTDVSKVYGEGSASI